MKIYVLSDLHNEFETFNPPETAADVVVLAGDIDIKDKGLAWAQEKFADTKVIWVLGNHEYYKKSYPRHLHKLKEMAEGTNVTILENDVVEIGDTIFLGCTLWTDFRLFGDPRISGIEATNSMSDYKKIRFGPSFRRLKSLDTVRIHNESIYWLKREVEKHRDRKLVIVTHHAPSRLSLPEEYSQDILSAAYASALDDFVASSGADLWIHGHVHTQRDYMIGKTRVVCNPRGYIPVEPNIDFVSEYILDI